MTPNSNRQLHNAAAWSEKISEELLSSRSSHNVAFRALIGFNDSLLFAEINQITEYCIEPPLPCGDSRYDAAIASIAEYYLTINQLPIPIWIKDPSRTLTEPWTPSPYYDPEEVHEIFRRHGVLLAMSELTSV